MMKSKSFSGGFFITLYDENSLKIYLNKGLYGFLMKPELNDKPSAHSRYFSILADYASSRKGTEIYFFINRKIYYGGKICGNKKIASFYVNGLTSPLGRQVKANLFWDESCRYDPLPTEGVFNVGNTLKAQPFIFQFKTSENTGKYIASDDLYFELSKKYQYPLPSNGMQGLGFCTLTPGEVRELSSLIEKSSDKIDFGNCENIVKQGKEFLFREGLVNISDDLVNEAQLEFTILSSLKPFSEFLSDNYVLCRQVPISPFKPMDMDRADICLYSLSSPIKEGTIPNVIIEVKKDKNGANMKAYNQVVRYLRWLEAITKPNEFSQIKAYIISPEFRNINKDKIDSKYIEKIKMFCTKDRKFVEPFK